MSHFGVAGLLGGGSRTHCHAAIRAVAEVSLFAAKDRTFKTVRPNQGTASGTVPIRRRPSL